MKSVFDMTEEELRAVAGAGGSPAGSPEPAQPQTPQSVFSMSPEQLLALANSNQPPASLDQRINQKAGSFATGANDAIAGTLGLPVDVAQGAANLGRRAYNYATGSEIAPFENWPGSSQGFREKVFAPTVGRTEPKDLADRLLYGAGSGVGSAATGFGVGSALSAAGRAPTVASALMGGTPQTASNWLNVASNLGGGVGSGVGSVAGGDFLSGLTNNNPAWRTVGEMGGGLLGGVAGAVAPAAGTVMAQGTDRMLRPFTQRGQEDIAGDVLNRSLIDRNRFGLLDPSQNPPQPLGIEPSVGNITNDPGLLRLERTVKQFSPVAGGQFDDLATRNNQTVRGALDQIGTPAGRTPGEISAQAAPLLEAERAAGRAREKATWDAIDPGNQVHVDMEKIRTRAQSYIDDLEMARRGDVPNDILSTVFSGGAGAKELPIGEMTAVRAKLRDEASKATRASDYDKANVVRGLNEAMFPNADIPLAGNVSSAAQARYDAARAESRAYNDTFNVKPLRNLFKPDGTFDSAALDTTLAPGAGQAERVQQYVSASMGNPDLAQHARDWFTAKLNDRMSASITQDNAGNQLIKPTELGNFVRANRALIDSPLFTVDQRKVVNDMVEAMRTLSRRPPSDGSPTAANLQGGNYVSALVGNWVKPVTAALGTGIGLAGGAAGAHLLPEAVPGGLAQIGGALAGAGGSGAIARSLADRMYTGPAEKVKDLLVRAMQDPQLASELLMRASQQNNAFASPQLRSLIGTLPLTINNTSRLSPP